MINIDAANVGRHVFRPARTWVHPLYNRVELKNDIGVIRVSRKFKFNDQVSRVLLPPPELFRNMEPANIFTTCYGMGWGYTEKDTLSDYLLFVELPLINNIECGRLLEKGKSYIQDTQVCTMVRAGGKDTCLGDSGGPLVCLGMQVCVIPNSNV